ncbi:MAG: hypothetical protein IE909_09000, partial [Campylobacterales bacterium]|nr:hypothetical protein [Campylobacterales bacterium]
DKLILNVGNSFEVETLAQWFNIPYKTTKQALWFNQHQLNGMAAGNYKEADFLRDIAVLLKNKGDSDSAKKLIQKALSLRPNGPVIKKLYEEWNENESLES